MKTRKPISVALSLLMAASGLMAVPFTASAATTNTITVTSNVTSPVTATYDANSSQVTVTYKLQADQPIVNTQAYLNYDSSVLTLANTAKTSILPVLAASGSAVCNTSVTNKVIFNATNQDFYSYTSKRTYATFKFDIVGTGDTTVSLNVECLTASSKTDPSTATSDDDVDLVYFDQQASSGFTFYSTASVTQAEAAKTLYMAAPTGSIGGWDGAEFYYNTTGALTGATVLPMTDTGNTIFVSAPGIKTVAPGNWKVYSVDLTAAQQAAVDSAALVGFKNANGDGRTGINVKCSVTKAPFAAKTSYNSNPSTVAQLADKIFIINGCYYAAAEANSYKGYWGTTGETYTAKTMYFYAPTGSKGAWGGVELFYGDSYSNVKTIKLAPGSGTRNISATGLTTVQGGAWKVYFKTLTLEQVMEIDNCKVVGFRNTTGSGRTSTTATYDIFRAPTSSSGSYGAKVSAARRGGFRFIITGCSNSNYEASSYTGIWAAS